MLPTPRSVRHVAMACDRSASRVDHEDYCHGCCSCLYRSKARSGLCWLDIGFASAPTYCVSVETNQGGADIRAPILAAILGE